MLKWLIFLASAIIALALAAYVMLFQPHIRVEHLRQSEQVETLRATWVAWACGGEERITEVLDNAGNIANSPLSIRVPKGVPHPEYSAAAHPGNVFWLTGYRYQTIQTNRITGYQVFLPSFRFDAIRWWVEAPYQSYTDDGRSISVDAVLEWPESDQAISYQEIIFTGVKGGC